MDPNDTRTLPTDEPASDPLEIGLAAAFGASPNEGRTGTHTPAESPGTIIAGKYKLLQQIGEGGMGSVWMADQVEPVKRRVAVKLIRTERGRSKTILSRFEAERQAIALMDHSNIAKLLDAGTTENSQPYFVMELVKGIPLTDYCDQHKLPIPDRLHLFLQICSAVQHAHQKGIIHRDLKPSNILVESHDGKPVPKVIDFGLAKATSGMQLTENTLFTGFGSVLGTPMYMAPEQANFNAIDVDTRADIYALGVILYELLTGSTPLTRETIRKAQLDEMLKLIREQEAPTPSSRLSTSDAKPTVAANRQTEPMKLSRIVKGDLDWIVMKSLSKERERRYDTAGGLSRDIQHYLGNEPVEACPPTAAYRLRKFVKKNHAAISTATTFVLLLVVGAGVATWQAVRATKAERVAMGARQAEAERAESERQAKLEAETKRKEAEQNLAFARKGNEILGSVFAGLDPTKIAESDRPLQDVLRENLETAVKELDGSAIGDPLEVAAMQNKLAESLYGLGEYQQAITLSGRALSTRVTKLGANHHDTLESMHNLASSYSAAGNLDKALPLFQETYLLRKKTLSANHPAILNSLSGLAVCYWNGKKPEKALPLFEETLKLSTAIHGPNNMQTYVAMRNLASCYMDLQQPEKALPLFEEVYQKVKKDHPHFHPQILASMGNLAGCYTELKRMDKARPLFEEAYTLSKQKLSDVHPQTLYCMHNLASFYASENKWDKAHPMLEEAYSRARAKFSPDHPARLSIMGNLATSFKKQNRLDRSIALLEELLLLEEKKFGRSNRNTQITVANLATNYWHAGRINDALPLLEETYRSSSTMPAFRQFTNTLLDCYVKSGKTAEAVKLIGELVAEARKTLPKDSVPLSDMLYQRGHTLVKLRAFAEAELLLRESLTIRQTLRPDAANHFTTQSLLGAALLGQKKHAEAEPVLIKVYEGMKHWERTDIRALARFVSTKLDRSLTDWNKYTLDRLIELYTTTNKPDELKKWKAERAKYGRETLPTPAANK